MQWKSSDELRDRFQSYGVVPVQVLFAPSEMVAMEKAHAAMLARGKAIIQNAGNLSCSLPEYYRQSGEKLIVVLERGSDTEVCRFEYLTGFSETVEQLVSLRLQPLIETVFGERCNLFKDKCNEKPPRGGAFKPHQDFSAYRIFPPRFYVTAMVALDDATLANGCVQFASGYRELARATGDFVEESFDSFPLLHYDRDGQNNGNITERVAAQLHWTPLPVRRGDVVIFDAFIPHYSEPNDSTARRRALFFTFNAAKDGDFYEDYYRAKRERYDDPAFHIATPTDHATLSMV